MLSNEEEQCVAVSFADDNNLTLEGENVEEKIQEIINLHEILHAGTGGRIEYNKTKYYP